MTSSRLARTAGSQPATIPLLAAAARASARVDGARASGTGTAGEIAAMASTTNMAAKPPPAIPLLFFAIIDLLVAIFLLVDGGFTIHFWLIAAIGLLLAGLGLSIVWRRAPE